MYGSLVFYNHYGNGDLFINRPFVKLLLEQFPARKFYYAHAKDPTLFDDVLGLYYMRPNLLCKEREPFFVHGDTVYLNTWIGYAYGKYVEPGVVCTVDNYLRMYKDSMNSLGVKIDFPEDLNWYIPTIDYRKLDSRYIKNINFFHTIYGGEKVFISNGDVQSGQADNFDFDPIIERLCDTFKEKLFFHTNPSEVKKDNLYYTKDIIEKEGTDLLENSYFSLDCHRIIGRSSGTYVYTQVRENYFKKDKTFIAITNNYKNGHLAFWDEGIKAKRLWFDSKNVYENIERSLNGN